MERGKKKWEVKTVSLPVFGRGKKCSQRSQCSQFSRGSEAGGFSPPPSDRVSAVQLAQPVQPVYGFCKYLQQVVLFASKWLLATRLGRGRVAIATCQQPGRVASNHLLATQAWLRDGYVGY